MRGTACPFGAYGEPTTEDEQHNECAHEEYVQTRHKGDDTTDRGDRFDETETKKWWVSPPLINEFTHKRDKGRTEKKKINFNVGESTMWYLYHTKLVTGSSQTEKNRDTFPETRKSKRPSNATEKNRETETRGRRL